MQRNDPRRGMTILTTAVKKEWKKSSLTGIRTRASQILNALRTSTNYATKPHVWAEANWKNIWKVLATGTLFSTEDIMWFMSCTKKNNMSTILKIRILYIMCLITFPYKVWLSRNFFKNILTCRKTKKIKIILLNSMINFIKYMRNERLFSLFYLFQFPSERWNKLENFKLFVDATN